MPTNYTPNYNLSQWEAEDKVLRTDFNADNAKIDAALKAEADARTAADASINRLVAQKADSATVAALSESRNCQVFYTTYVGDGTSGPDAPCRMTFPHKPLFIYIIGNWGSNLALVQGHPYANRSSGRRNNIEWSGNSVSWYEDSGGFAASPTDQCNTKDAVYCVFAILELES